MNTDDQIRALDVAGKSQAEICRELNLTRGVVQAARRRMGLITAPYRGWRKPPSPEVKRKFLTLVRGGMSMRRASHEVGIREDTGRAIARRAGFRHTRGQPGYRYQISEETMRKLRAAILDRQDFCRNLAIRFGVSERFVRKLAHRLLGVSQFRRRWPTLLRFF